MASTIDRWLICLLLVVSVACAANAELTPAQERGRQIYFGEPGSALDSAKARIGEMGVKLPAQSFPCASCHGQKGAGVAERGAVPADLSAGALTKPYSVTGTFGRKRPPYALSTFKSAVRTGKDAGGNQLADAMPRFELSDRDLSDVWAFLEVMDELTEPGMTEDILSIGVRLSGGGKSGAATAQRKLLESLAGEVNRIGGIHGRKLRFVYAGAGGLKDDAVFAGLDLDPAAGNLPETLPVLSMMQAGAQNSGAFYLVAGPADQAASLRLFAVRELGAVSVKDACVASSGEVRLLSAPHCMNALAGAKRALVPQPVFSAIPPADRRKLPAETYVALPAPVRRVSPQAQTAFAKARAAIGSGRETVLAEAEAYSAAATMIEALMRAGRDVTRSDFISTLESISEFEGAATPPVTFGPNRHTGSRGAEIVRYDPATGALAVKGVWVDPDGK